MNRDFWHHSVFLFVFLILFLNGTYQSNAQEDISYTPIQRIILDTDSITLDEGESYTFTVNFIPENPFDSRLSWINTNGNVVKINEETNTLTAVSPGTARLIAESFDKSAFSVCEVTVNGLVGKDTSDSATINGAEIITLSPADRKKIDAPRIIRYLEFLESSEFSAEDADRFMNLTMEVSAEVCPGSEESESSLAAEIGMSKAYPMKMLNTVNLIGTFEEILRFTHDNADLIRLFELGKWYYTETELEPISKTIENHMNLKDHVEELTSVSNVHKMGFTGKGVTIAILDSGLDSRHEQYGGRVIAEHCFSTGQDVNGDPYSSCKDGISDVESAYPGNAMRIQNFNHGSHVTGIAAGIDGIAPGANIVAVQVMSEVAYPAYYTTFSFYDLEESINWLLDLQEDLIRRNLPKIKVVNLSIGGGGFRNICDSEPASQGLFSFFSKMAEAGMILVAPSGNYYYNDFISMPACFSNVIAVGALSDLEEPRIAPYSDHSQLIDILAPGTSIYSAQLVNISSSGESTCSFNCYGTMSGTSQAAPIISGALALIMEALPDKAQEEYLNILLEISSVTTSRRSSGRSYDSGGGYQFDYEKPVLNFSDFTAYYEEHKPVTPQEKPDLTLFPVSDIEWLTGTTLPATGLTDMAYTPFNEEAFDLAYNPTGLTLQIPGLEIAEPILAVPKTDRGYPVERLGKSIGLPEESSLPGEGITILTGHNHLDSITPGPFVFIADLENNDRIMITDQNGNLLLYQVYGNYKISADGFDTVIDKLRKNGLVLITCEDESIDGGYINRRIILADLLDAGL